MDFLPYPRIARALAFLAVLILGSAVPADAAPGFAFSSEEQEVVRPKATFEPDLHKAALGSGTCTISGVAFYGHEKRYLPKDTKIYLFPYTLYTKEAIQLFQRHEPVEQEHSLAELVPVKGLPVLLPKVQVEVEPQFSQIWKRASVEKNGKFVFDRIKPGVYYLQSHPILTARYRGAQVGKESGEWSSGEGSPPAWLFDWTTTYLKVELAKIVEVKENGQAVEVELNQTFQDIVCPPVEARVSVTDLYRPNDWDNTLSVLG